MKMISYLLAFSFIVMTGNAQAGPMDGGFVKAQGTHVVDSKGREVRLKGFGLGNWYLPEGYMWKFGGQGDRPRKIEAVVIKVLGAAEAQAFWKSFRDNYINENDIRRIAELGFNSVRPALKARDFMREPGGEFIEQGFQRVDQLVGWCKKYNLYCILDLHAAPGAQTGKNIDDSAFDKPELYSNGGFQNQCEALWVKLATRYKDEAAVAGYDLLNEPLPDDFKQFKPKLEPLYKRLGAAIRKVDARHILIVEGSNWANDWSVFGAPFDPNMIYQFHKYWNDPDRASVQGYLDFQNRYNVPVWVGEFGESKVGSHWYWATTQLFDDIGFGWCFWPWKKLETQSSPYSIRMPKGWDKIQAVSNGSSAPPRAEGRAIMAEFLNNIKMENCVFVPEVINDLLHRVPARIEAEDFGHLGEGKSFHIAESGRRARFYRKAEPVNIESMGAGQGYNVGWIERGEWLQYELNVESAGLYDFSFRIAAEGGGKSFRLEQDGRDLSGEIGVPSTGSWSKWTLIEKKAVALKKGPLKLRIFFTTGGYNFDYFTATLPGQALPSRPENSEMRRSKVGTLPGKVEAEDFGLLGEGRSYHDADAANSGAGLRMSEGVDIQALEEDAGLSVKMAAGEWLNYEINVSAAQSLRVYARAVAEGGGTLDLILDGKPAAAIKVGATWSEAPGGSLALSAGRHFIGLKDRQGSVSVDWIELRP